MRTKVIDPASPPTAASQKGEEPQEGTETEEIEDSPYLSDIKIDEVNGGEGIVATLILRDAEGNEIEDSDPIVVTQSCVIRVSGDILILDRPQAEKLHAALSVTLGIGVGEEDELPGETEPD